MEDSTWIKWLDDQVVRPSLEDGTPALEAWRSQIPTRQGEAKNWENWLLVEMVCRLRRLGVERIRTNGTLPGIERGYRDRPQLKGRKKASGSISPDIAVYLKPLDENLVVNVEIKTQGMDNKVYVDDVRLVKFHNQHEPKLHYRACFLWAGLASVEKQEHFEKKARKVARRVSEATGLDLNPHYVRPWLAYLITTCVPE